MAWRQSHHISVCICSNRSVEYLFSPALTFSSLFKAKESQWTEFLWAVFNYSIYLNAVVWKTLLLLADTLTQRHVKPLNIFKLFRAFFPACLLSEGSG